MVNYNNRDEILTNSDKKSMELIQLYNPITLTKRQKIFPKPTQNQIITRELRQTANRIVRQKRQTRLRQNRQHHFILHENSTIIPQKVNSNGKTTLHRGTLFTTSLPYLL